jgi:hypothetical protein
MWRRCPTQAEARAQDRERIALTAENAENPEEGTRTSLRSLRSLWFDAVRSSLTSPRHAPSVWTNRGAFRAFSVCSSAYAYRISPRSDHARPMNEIPTGRPLTSPAGIVTLG